MWGVFVEGGMSEQDKARAFQAYRPEDMGVRVVQSERPDDDGMRMLSAVTVVGVLTLVGAWGLWRALVFAAAWVTR